MEPQETIYCYENKKDREPRKRNCLGIIAVILLAALPAIIVLAVILGLLLILTLILIFCNKRKDRKNKCCC